MKEILTMQAVRARIAEASRIKTIELERLDREHQMRIESYLQSHCKWDWLCVFYLPGQNELAMFELGSGKAHEVISQLPPDAHLVTKRK